MKMSALGEAFSVVMRVCNSPAAASGRISTSMPGTDFLKASTKAVLVDSLSAEYTLTLPEALTAAAGALAAGALVGAAGWLGVHAVASSSPRPMNSRTNEIGE